MPFFTMDFLYLLADVFHSGTILCIELVFSLSYVEKFNNLGGGNDF